VQSKRSKILFLIYNTIYEPFYNNIIAINIFIIFHIICIINIYCIMMIKNLIIGSGVSGLYLGHLFQELKKDYLIVEKNDYIGGRILVENIDNIPLSLGAGIIRANDNYVINLCKKLDVKLNENNSVPKYHKNLKTSYPKIQRLIEIIKETYQQNLNDINMNLMTFEDFINKYFNVKLSNYIKKVAYYHDCWNEDVHIVIKDYPIDEMFNIPRKYYLIDGGWNVLIDKLSKNLNIKLNEQVTEIDWSTRKIITTKATYFCERLFICADASIKKIKLILPKPIIETMSIIKSVNFLRIYTYYKKGHNLESMQVPGPLEKIIKINDKILMVAYCEKSNADSLNRMIKNDAKSIDIILKNTLNVDLKSDGCIAKYWKNGIHYYIPSHIKPIYEYNGVYLLGEMNSDHQGWVQGSLQSIERILNRIDEF